MGGGLLDGEGSLKPPLYLCSIDGCALLEFSCPVEVGMSFLPQSKDMQVGVGFIGGSELAVGVSVSVNGRFPLYTGPVMDM